MNRSKPLINAFFLIKKNRFRRKLEMHKKALQLMIDGTTAFYSLILVGYVVISVFMVGDFLEEYNHFFLMVEKEARRNFWLVITAIPIRNVMQSFSRPGIIFSSSEYRLSATMPFAISSVWFLSALEKWLKQFLILTMIGIILFLFTPISAFVIVTYIALIMSMNVLLTIPHWKLYQAKVFVKIGILSLILFINAMIFLLDLPWAVWIVLLCIIVLNILLNRTLFQNINWGHITEVCDFQIWNMTIITKASKVNMKRQRKYSIFQFLGRFKRPFKYKVKGIYPRIWHIYFIKNLKTFLQMVGALLLLLTVFLFLNENIFVILFAVSIYIYTSLLSSFFQDQFNTDIIQALPWNMEAYKRTFPQWPIYGGIVLMVPLIIYGFLYPTGWYPLQLLFYVIVGVMTYEIKIEVASAVLRKNWDAHVIEETVMFISLVLVCLSVVYKAVCLMAFVLLYCFIYKRTKKHWPWNQRALQ